MPPSRHNAMQLHADRPLTDHRRPAPRGKPRLLCVDDEPHVLEGLRDTLHGSFRVQTAESGPAGLERLAEDPASFAIVISDMRMPGMNGAAFLREARRVAPDATRLLLTGYADVDAAIAAVNDGHLFRFLTKPCAPEILMRACAGALSQHNLVTAERVLLEQTVRGSVAALVDLFAMANPAAVGRAVRVRELVSQLGHALGLHNVWEVEVAAMLAHVGAVTLPPATAERYYTGAHLAPEEAALVERLPGVPRRLLAQIPRLDGVLAMIESCAEPAADAAPSRPSAGARVLKIATDFDALESVDLTSAVVIGTMRTRGCYDPDYLDALAGVLGVGAVPTILEASLAELRPGMLLADDVRSPNGGLLIARGQVVSDEIIDRLVYRATGVREPLLVVEPGR